MADVDISTAVETVTVAESVELSVIFPVSMREIPPVYAPVAESEAGAGERLSLDALAPFASCTSSHGSNLDKKAPVASGAGTTSFDAVLSLGMEAPVPSLVGAFGSELSVKAPLAEGEAVVSFSNHIALDGFAPLGRSEISLYEEQILSLNEKSPFFFIAATASSAYTGMGATAPVWFGDSLLGVTSAYLDLAAKSPVANTTYESMLIFCGEITLDVNAPAGTMLEDTGVSDSDSAIATYADLYDYTLEYSR